MMRVSIILLLLLCALRVSAQQYPVRVQVQVLQPVSAQLANLYSGTQARMIVTLLNTDLQKPSLSVRLRCTIKGTTTTLRNKDYGYYPALQLDAGMPLQLSLNDLAPYFSTNNLEAPVQLLQSGRLPDGYYTFCVEAVEVNSGQLVSNSTQGCSPPLWISTSEPPLLNLPLKNEAVAYRDPLNLIFNWTPRHMSSANAAFQTEYEFTISELWDTGILPEAAFGNTPPLYQTTTNATTFLYGPAQPPLLPGKKYGWRVKAKAKMGIDEFDVFLNNGYSEVFYFNLQEDCQPPAQVVSTIENGRVTIAWLRQPKMYEYVVEYREEGEWFSVKTTDDHATIYDAVAGHRYEYRVGGYCTQGNKTLGDLHGFVMPARDTARDKRCGIIPDIKLTNKTPIQELQNGDQIMAGDFPVRLMVVRGNGSFTGTGYVMIPFLSDAKVKVSFNNITVNTNHQLMSGMIMTTFDSTAAQVVKTGDVINAFKDMATVIFDLANLSVDADYILVKELTDAVKKAAEEELPDALKDKMITAANNLEAAKQAYDEAKKAYDNAATPEEKAAAKEEMEKASQAFKDAKDEIAAVNKEKEKLVKDLANILYKSFKELKEDANKWAADAKIADQKAAFKKALYESQGLKETPATGNIVIGKITEVTITSSEVTKEMSSYDKVANDYLLSIGKVKLSKIMDAINNYYKDPATLSALFVKDEAIGGKSLLKFVMEESMKGKSEAELIPVIRKELLNRIVVIINAGI